VSNEVRVAKVPESLPTRFSALLRDLARMPEADPSAGWERRLEPGTVIGRFELVREVGRGGFGTVYEARDRDLGRTVAFKAVLPGADVEVREERLIREAEAAARLSHPNIVTLYDVGRSENGSYLVLEFLRGQTLGQRLGLGPLSTMEALRIAVEVAKGIAHAHASGVVHRDLSPANVFLCDDGQVKVLDLGMAHAFGRRRVEGGTVGYMAPEQRRGAPEDERTDVFALGVILYRMLAGELPFRDAPDTGAPAPVLEVPGAPGLGEFLARMLAADPVERPRDAGVVVAELTPLLRELERSASSGSLPPTRKSRRRAWPLAAAVAAVLLFMAGVAVSWSWPGARQLLRMEPTPALHSIAVLPFADLSPERDQEFFSDGLSDEILNALAHIDGLRVPGRTSSFFFKGRNVRLTEIGRELNVATVLEGSVRKSGNHVRVTAQIVNVADGYRLWGQSYDRELTDIFAVQDEIARAVVRALNVQLLGREQPPASFATSNPEAYTQYLLGKQLYHRLTRESLRGSVAAFEKAVALDPGYAPAWAGMGLPLYLLYQDGDTLAALQARRARALAAAEKAVALAPELSDALSTRGFLRGAVRGDWAGATTDLEHAIALNPSDAAARRRYGILLKDLGRMDDGLAQLRKAVEIDPLGHSWNTLGVLEQFAGNLEAAEAAFRRYSQIAPDSVDSRLNLARNQVLRSRLKEALALFEALPDEASRLWGRAVVEHGLGHRAASDAALKVLVEKDGLEGAVRIAEVHAWRGDEDAAFEWLDRALADPGSLAGEFRMNPFFRSLRGDPRTSAVLRKMKLPAE
jgi:serine/threonine protein kinase/tetratricopeptide (TPR) repeat protein